MPQDVINGGHKVSTAFYVCSDFGPLVSQGVHVLAVKLCSFSDIDVHPAAFPLPQSSVMLHMNDNLNRRCSRM